MKKRTLVLVLMCVAFGGLSPAIAMEKLIFNTGIRDPFTTNKGDGFIDQIIHETFRRIDIDAKLIVYQNSAKALINANNGIDDGAALRIQGLEKKYPNLIRIPEKLMDNEFVAYSMNPPVATNEWSAMAGAKIAYINGWQIFQNNLADHKATTRTKNAQKMFDLLSSGKVDLMLYERWQGLWRAQQLGINIQVSEPPLAKREMFMYLNNKHADLVDKASTALAEMKQDGTYQEIFNRTLGQLRN
ncbi:MAG: hypothetical protein COB59_00935 [Rhodospirillaceae bacterium]|nr:MAG: hypothetical protein COB59_00935 [Rhodospirillaceae bacterium]